MEPLLDCTFNEARKAYLRGLCPFVFFCLPPPSDCTDYRQWLNDLLEGFSQSLCENKECLATDIELSEHEGHEGSCVIFADKNQKFLCKLFWFSRDEPFTDNLEHPYTGLLFCGHMYLLNDAQYLHSIYGITDAFERYLRRGQVEFFRYNMPEERTYILQDAPCPYFFDQV